MIIVLCTFQRVVQKYWYSYKTIIRKGALGTVAKRFERQHSEQSDEDEEEKKMARPHPKQPVAKSKANKAKNACQRFGSTLWFWFRYGASQVGHFSFNFVTSFFEVCMCMYICV